MRLSLSSAVLLFAISQQVADAASSANPDDPAGTVLYITSPACGSFRCNVEWAYGQTVLVNWLRPPPGRVSVSLASNNGGPLYSIASSAPAVTTDCNSGAGAGVAVAGVTCGSLSFIVPSGFMQRTNYTIVVASLSNPTDVGYTDAITIVAGNGTTTPPSGTSIQLVGAGATSTPPASSATSSASPTSASTITPVRSAGAATSAPSSSALPVSKAGRESILEAGGAVIGAIAGVIMLL